MLWVGFECDLGRAARASDVEAEDRDGVVFLFGGFFPRVEFSAFVDIFATGGTAHAERRHQAHSLLFRTSLLGTTAAFELGWVEVGRVVLGKDLAFGHVGGVVVLRFRYE